MKRLFCCLLITTILFSFIPMEALADSSASVSINPGSWAAVDGLGRTVSTYSEVGATRENKFVGIFYWPWHYKSAFNKPRNMTQLLEQYPDMAYDWNHPAWENTADATPYFWNEPLFGYYTNTDEYVVRKHAELLADAGVDVIVFDCTNGVFTWEDGYETLLKVFDEARKEGVDTPQIAFMLNFAACDNTRAMIKNLYRDIYYKDRYRDLWFMWEGKPLIMAYPESLDTSKKIEYEISEFFTFRRPQASYFTEQNSIKEGQWGWLSVYPQGKYGVREDGSVEQMTVGTAQNANEFGLTSMNDPRGGVHGRSYTEGLYSYQYKYKNEIITVDSSIEDSKLYGLNFQQQWDYALEVDPDFIFVTGWNEWVAGRMQYNWVGKPTPSVTIVDQYTDEYSRDIEPSKGDLKDHYYYQLVDNIRKFKGVDKPQSGTQEKNVNKTIDIFSNQDMWADVLLEYNHYTGSTRDRNSNGWGDLVYVNNTMRNDITTSKVAYDDEYIYFMVETVDDITSPDDPAWMRLLIDVDYTGVTDNWEGFEYIINRVSHDDNKAIIEKSSGGWQWSECGKAQFSVSGNRLQLAVPRSAIALDIDDAALNFNFKWADNTIADGSTEDSGDILDFYQYGDVAPGGRFMFSFTTVEYSDNSDSTNSLPWYLYAGGVLLVICVVAVIIFIIVRKKKVTAPQT